MKYRANQSAIRKAAAGALLVTAIATLTLGPLLPVVAAELDKELARQLSRESANEPATTSAINSTRSRFLSLGVGKSVVVDLPRDVKDVLVADPKIANAVIRSAQRA